MIPPGTPAAPTVRTEPDRWLAKVRRGLLLAGGALGLRWFLALLWVLVHRSSLVEGADVGRTVLALQFLVDAALAGAAVVGVFWLTERAIPRVPTRRFALRGLAIADAGFSLARAVSFGAFGAFEGGALLALVQCAAAVALLARLADVCDAGHERVAATWARSGAFFLVLMTFFVGVVALVPGGRVTAPMIYAWSLGVLGLVGVTTFATLRAVRWM